MIDGRAAADALFRAALPHVWSSTVFLALVLVIGYAARNRLTAAGRYVLAVSGIAKFALPAVPLAALRFTPPEALRGPAGVVTGSLAIPTATISRPVWPLVVVAVWLAIAVLLMLRALIVRGRIVGLSVRTALPPHPRESAALDRARRRIGVTRSIDIARAAFAEAPAVLRVLRPLVILPARGCDDLSDPELESLLCHECAHVARHDNLVAALESVICSLFWFHPLIWIAQRITIVERERACDEAVAGSADERATYLTALTRFCQATIAPRLPGVSCMATARLKERMDHVTNYPSLRAVAASPRRVALSAAASLLAFTIAAGVSSSPVSASPASAPTGRYAVRFEATRTGDDVTLVGSVTDNETQEVLAAPKIRTRVDVPAHARAGQQSEAGATDIVFDIIPDGPDAMRAETTISRDGAVVQKTTARIVAENAPAKPKYTGQPISMQLRDADLRDLIQTFGKLTGMAVVFDTEVTGKVSVDWKNVPWDQAFATLLDEHGLTYTIDGKTIHVKKK